MHDSKNQGEGDRDAARRYNKASHDFVETENVTEKARQAGNVSEQEMRKLKEAEKAGKERAKEKDPAVSRDYSKPKK